MFENTQVQNAGQGENKIITYRWVSQNYVGIYIKHVYILFEKRLCAKPYTFSSMKCNQYNNIVLKLPYYIPVLTVLTDFLRKMSKEFEELLTFPST